MVSGQPALTRVSQQQIGATSDTCLVDGVCVPADVLTHALAVTATAAFAIAVLLALSRLHQAVDALDAERDRTRAERDAFDRFVERISGIDPESPGLTDGGPKVVTGREPGRLSEVVDAYRDTIMSLEHYDDEYDDTLAEHMAAEFGEDVALAVANGAILSPQLQRTLCRTGTHAKERRDRLLSALDSETDSLADAMATLRELDADLEAVDASADRDREALVGDWHVVRDVDDRTVSLLEARQHDIHQQRHVVGHGDGPTALYEYVYGGLPSTYPVLSAGTRLLDRTRSLRRKLSRSYVAR
jgi:hypothetical protein